MALEFYNTLTREKEIFTPINPPNVGFYSCGPTVYNYPHIGNYRAYIFADILKRVLLYEHVDIEVCMMRNETSALPNVIIELINRVRS